MKIEIKCPEVEALSEKIEILSDMVSYLTTANAILLEKINLHFKFEEKKYTINEVCKLFNKKRPQIYKWFAQGLNYEYLGSKRYIYATALNKFIEQSNKHRLKRQQLQISL